MNTGYYTIKSFHEEELIIEKSRFIGQVAPTNTEDEAQQFIEQIKKKHKDATHNVWAYIVKDSGTSRYSDDKEPSGSAGVPTLTVLQKQNLTNITFVVTRYFGGVKLGAGGLIRAYSSTVSKTLAQGERIFMDTCVHLSLSISYPFLDSIKRDLSLVTHRLESIDYGENVTLSILLTQRDYPQLVKTCTSTTKGKLHYEISSPFFSHLPS